VRRIVKIVRRQRDSTKPRRVEQETPKQGALGLVVMR
jgi:hypothetical protein